MRKTIFKRISMMLACIFLLNTTFLYAYSSRTAVIEKAEGSVYIKKSGGEKKSKAFKGINLSEGDTIITGRDGTATLKIDNDKTISIAPNSVINLSDLKGKKGSEVTTLSQPKGTTVTKIDNKLLGNSRYNQKTPTAIMGVKGTIFSVQQVGSKFFITVADGKVGVQGPNNTQSPSITPGQQIQVSDTALGLPENIDLSQLSPFIIDEYGNYPEDVDPALAKAVSDYLKAHPELFETPAAAQPAAAPPAARQIDYAGSTPNSGGGGGASSSSGNGTGGTPPVTTPPIIVPPVIKVDLSEPLRYGSLTFSEYISQNYSSPQCLSDFLVSLGVNSSFTESNGLTINLAGTPKEIHLRKDNAFTIQPNTGRILPQYLFDISPNVAMQFNAYLGETETGTKHWVKLTTPLPTYSSDGYENVISSILSRSSDFPRSIFELHHTLSIRLPQNGSTVSRQITFTPFGQTTPSTFTVGPNKPVFLTPEHFNNAAVTIDGQILSSIQDPQDPLSIVAALNAINFEAAYELEIVNRSNKPKQLGIDLTLSPENDIPFNLPSTLSSEGFKASLEEVNKLYEGPAYIHSQLKEILPNGMFRTLAPLTPENITLDALNLINVKYESNNTEKPVNCRVIYRANLF